MNVLLKSIVSSLFILLASSISPVHAQTVSSNNIQCGDKFEAEFTAEIEEHYYLLDMSAGDSVQARVTPFGQQLSVGLIIYDPMGNEIDGNYNRGREGPKAVSTGVLSGRGRYSLLVYNTWYTGWENTGIGLYTFEVSCTLRDGTVIEAGSEIVPTQQATTTSVEPLTVAPILGFSGLAPIDFSAVQLFPLIPDLPITGSIAPQETSVFGLSFTANAGDILDISAQRSVGDLGVGFVIFAKPNTLVFIAGPVSATTFSAQVTLPQTGEYVIGLFRMGELPPGAQATAFQITASINP
ncbi:MAG: hypothetical protein J0M33_20275 [Anaerolineae bacterium]|nr:hypothetical protein [Anaerolineae bacterium]